MTNKKQGSVEKTPLTDVEWERVLQAATNKSEEARMIVLILRWTGMHVSILAEPIKYNLHIETEKDGEYFIWNRTKKTKKKEAHTNIKIHSSIDFNLHDFINELKRRRTSGKKRQISRQYFYETVKDVGERAGIPSLSPMSFRHTLGVSMLNDGYPESFVQQKLNCSTAVLKTYLKQAKKTGKPLYQRFGW